MANTIIFSLRIIDEANHPVSRQSVNCILKDQSLTRETSEIGIVEFEFTSTKKSEQILIKINDIELVHVFCYGDSIKIKLSTSKPDMFLELITEGIS